MVWRGCIPPTRSQFISDPLSYGGNKGAAHENGSAQKGGKDQHPPGDDANVLPTPIIPLNEGDAAGR